jgi:hypothetical protein
MVYCTNKRVAARKEEAILMETKIYGDPITAKVLVIGHDPRLQESSTIAPYCFFADYYFHPIPTKSNERAKYDLAAALFAYIRWLTSDHYTDTQVVITNLCNTALPHAPSGRTVYIPEQEASIGLHVIRDILAKNSVEIIFAMSLQVNYWLQYLGLYGSVPTFLQGARPKQKGTQNILPYYEPAKSSMFPLICGNKYMADDRIPLYPVLHVKNWPLKGKFLDTYEQSYVQCREGAKTAHLHR